MNDMNNEKNKSSVILNPERSEWVSRSHVTSVEIVVNDGVKTKRYSAKRDLYARSPNGSRLKMTTPASCRKAHKRRFLLNQWILRFANVSLRMTFFALLFTLITTAESRADDAINCLTGQQSCGTSCCWSYDSETKKLSITGGADGSVGVMDDYLWTGAHSTYKTNTPWDDYRGQIQSVDIKDVGNVGKNAFKAFSTIKEVNMDENITSIGLTAFWSCQITNLQLPDSIKTIEEGAFSWNENSEMLIPDTLEDMGMQKNHTKRYIICKGNEDTCLKIQENLNIEGEYEFSLAKKEQCTGTNYYWSGTNCNNKKNGIRCASAYSFDDENNCIICDKQGYRNVDGYCNRIRYTPAEAAEVLKDDNTNEITITFKK